VAMAFQSNFLGFLRLFTGLVRGLISELSREAAVTIFRYEFMNQTMEQLFEEYRDEMRKALESDEIRTYRRPGKNFVQNFERKIERLDALIALFSALILIRVSESGDDGENIFFDLN
jgi:hypothetical protein